MKAGALPTATPLELGTKPRSIVSTDPAATAAAGTVVDGEASAISTSAGASSAVFFSSVAIGASGGGADAGCGEVEGVASPSSLAFISTSAVAVAVVVGGSISVLGVRPPRAGEI